MSSSTTAIKGPGPTSAPDQAFHGTNAMAGGCKIRPAPGDVVYCCINTAQCNPIFGVHAYMEASGAHTLVLGCARMADLKLIGHAHQFGQRTSAHFAYHLASMNLHRYLADAHVAGDLLVQTARGDKAQHLAFARRQALQP